MDFQDQVTEYRVFHFTQPMLNLTVVFLHTALPHCAVFRDRKTANYFLLDKLLSNSMTRSNFLVLLIMGRLFEIIITSLKFVYAFLCYQRIIYYLKLKVSLNSTGILSATDLVFGRKFWMGVQNKFSDEISQKSFDFYKC